MFFETALEDCNNDNNRRDERLNDEAKRLQTVLAQLILDSVACAFKLVILKSKFKGSWICS